MSKRQSIKTNNKGITLIELVVVILMVGIISTMLVVFISSSRANYTTLSTEVTLQQEAGYALSYIGDVAVEAEEFCEVKNLSVNGNSVQAFYIKAPDSATQINYEKDYYYILVREQDNTLRFFRLSSENVDSSDFTELGELDMQKIIAANDVLGNSRRLLANYVEDISVTQDKKLLKLVIKLQLLGKEYTAKKSVYGRNLR